MIHAYINNKIIAKQQAHVGSLLNYLNVLDFGATGDGVTDDYAAIQDAVDAAAASTKALRIPAGHYKLSNAIVIDDSGFNLLVEDDAILEFEDNITPVWLIYNTTTPENASGASGAKTGIIVITADNVNIKSYGIYRSNIANNNYEISPGITLYTECLTFYNCSNSNLSGYSTFEDTRNCVGAWDCTNSMFSGLYRKSVNSFHLLQSTIVAIGGSQNIVINTAIDDASVNYANGVIEGIDMNNGNNNITINNVNVNTNIEANGTSNIIVTNSSWKNASVNIQTRSTQKYSSNNFETVSGSNFTGLHIYNCTPELTGDNNEAGKLVTWPDGYDIYDVVFDQYDALIKAGADYQLASILYALYPCTFKSFTFKNSSPKTEIALENNTFIRFSDECIIENGVFENNNFTFAATRAVASVITVLDADYLRFTGNSFTTTNDAGRGAALSQVVGTIVTINNTFIGSWDTEFDLPA